MITISKQITVGWFPLTTLIVSVVVLLPPPLPARRMPSVVRTASAASVNAGTHWSVTVEITPSAP